VSSPSEVYDAVELRRRIVVCFTPGELRELAEQLGVAGSIAWERGAQEAARELVKQCERYAGLPALVAKLREVRPLVEWPEAAQSAEQPAAPAAFPQAPPLAPLPGAPPAAAQPPSAPIADPFAPPAAAPPPAPAPPPASSASPSPMWPGLAAAPAAQPPPRGLDPRILVAVAALMLLAAIVAYLAGRAANPPPTAAATPTDTAPPRRGDGPAALAADTVARRLASLARICELPPGSSDGELVFRRAFERCGPAPPAPQRPYIPSTREPAPEPSTAANDDAPPDPAPRPHRRGGDAHAGDTAPQPAKGCTGACDAEHRACKTRCGPEPTESGGYDAYQRCLGRCLTDASRCRLACH
jgi:hypothetical protein